VQLQWTIQGWLIYAAMLLYASALAAWFMWVGRRRFGMALYACGFAAAAAAVIYRGLDVAHIPLGNLYEVFLVLGMLMFPLSIFCRRVLGIGEEPTDIILGIVLLAPAGFVLSARSGHLLPALQSPLFVPHVAAYVAAYVIMAKAAVPAMALMVAGDKPGGGAMVSRSEAVGRLVRLGFPFLTAGLLLGAVWGKQAWGDWWNWDPKELWSLATWLVYVGYFHFRAIRRGRNPRVCGAVVVLGAVLIVITLLWVNLSRLFAGLHSYA